MNKTKVFLTILSSLTFLNTNHSFALTTEDIESLSLKSYLEFRNQSKDLKNYLIENGIKPDEYNTYLEKSKLYLNSSLEAWERIETSTILLDEVLFKSNNISECYNAILSRHKDEYDAFIEYRQSLLGNPVYVLQEFNQSIQSDMKSVFEKTFYRAASDTVEYWLQNIKTFKFASYSGFLNKELNLHEQNVISSGKGYTLQSNIH